MGTRTLTAFAPGEYERVLQALVELGYSAVSLAGLDATKRQMFLRHDVDLCLDRALQIAQREAALGLSATYYVLVSTQLYSVASTHARRVLRDIVALGHDVGLHFDAENLPDPDASLSDAAERDCEILELCSGQPVTSISFHRPAPQYLNWPHPIAGRRHCYEPAFFSDIGYISDSNGGWHHGHPLDHPAVKQGRAIQLLTHPIWWCNDRPTPTVEAVGQLLNEKSAALKSGLADTVTAYRQSLTA
jgi:hypothetical protein